MNQESLGPAEVIIQGLLAHGDHLVHNRAGIVRANASSPIGVTWSRAVYKVEDGTKNVYELKLVGKRETRTKIGVLQEDGTVMNGPSLVGRYQNPGMFPEVASWMYRQVAEVWKLDNEFAARWASYAFKEEHRDRKVVLAAFLLVQSRKGEPVLDAGKVAFHDDDFRDVGEAMVLLDGPQHFDVKMLLRIRELLRMPDIAAMNHALGFGNSTRRPFLGRFEIAAEKWLRYREENPKLLAGLIKKGFRSSLIELSNVIRYKPTSSKFFQTLRWKQEQAADGRRSIAIGEAVAAADSWAGLSEEQVCERIVAQKPDFKRVVGLVPPELGLTRAIMAAAIEAGSLSNKDLIIATPTLEELGLLQVPNIQGRWQAALKAAEDQRAINIASRVRTQETREQLQEAGEVAGQKAVEEVTRNLRMYVIVDVSGSMEGAIERAKQYLQKILPVVPLERLHVVVFNVTAREVEIKHASAAGVENAFKGIKASGGTDHTCALGPLKNHRPAEDEDALFIFIGDEADSTRRTIAPQVVASGLRPVALAMIPVVSNGSVRGHTVRTTAIDLGIPFFELDERIFAQADPYAIPRTLRTLIASTPVSQIQRPVPTPRVTLVDVILRTELLRKPVWAA